MLTADQESLLTALNATWPAEIQVTIDAGEVRGRESHPLRAELSAFRGQEACCLPYFMEGSEEIAWFNLAPDANELRATVQDLRAWIIPSMAWEDPRGWLVTAGTATGKLSQLVLAASPAGYCRWRSRSRDFGRITNKLRQIRTLDERRPQHVVVRIPSLFEARHQFVTALVAGDKPAAESAIDVIDHNRLDAADNALFMRVLCWERFGEFSRIAEGSELDRLNQLRIPHRVRLCVLHAFHELFLVDHESDNENPTALAAYRENVHAKIGDMVRRCRSTDAHFAPSMLVYRALVDDDSEAAERLLPEVNTALAELLSPLAERSSSIPSIDERFFEARKRQDWSEVQRIGAELVEQGPEYVSILRKSLEFSINPDLEAALLSHQEAVGTATEAEPASIPQTWNEWFESLTDDRESLFQPFLENRSQTDLGRLEPADTTSLHEALERFYVEASFETDGRMRQMLLSGLPEFIEDFVVEPDFPRDSLADIYLDLFRLWSAIKRGSAYPPDGQVLLNLAEGVLQFRQAAESEVVDELRRWWENRPVKALLPFLLGIVDLLDHVGSEGQCESFWVVGAEFLRHNQQYPTPGERALWRQIGSRIGYDESILDEYVPIPATEADVDPLQQANLRKVAIVSMRERQAREAAAMISERSGAEAVIVSDKVAGAATDNAVTADVVLFVWSATSHAVFRAFDGVDRERLAYVQGTGAGSILLALERWVVARAIEPVE